MGPTRYLGLLSGALWTAEAWSPGWGGWGASASFSHESVFPWSKTYISVPNTKTWPTAWTDSWADCSTEEVTVVETQTIVETGSVITITETSTTQSGVVLNTTQVASSAVSDTSPITLPLPVTISTSTSTSSPSYTATSETATIPAPYSVSTITKFATEYTTSTAPVSIVTEITLKTQPASTLSCPQGCKVDVTATKLIYPTSVVFVTVPVTTDSLPEPHTPDAITWVYNGVTLTYPTTYLFYSEFSHSFLDMSATAILTVCPTASDTLTLPSPTNYAPLIYPQQETPGPDLPPSALISYLNGQQTVLVQLSGTPIGSSCDPVGGGIVAPVSATGPAQVVYTSTYILAQPTSTTSTTETLVAVVGSTSTSISTSSVSSDVLTVASPVVTSTGTSTVIISSASVLPSVAVVTTNDSRRQVGGHLLAFEALVLGVATFFLGML